ncbi:MAG TPA: biotin/lipoyl-binding protein, partial [Polyangia bacterium]|nr:biotin/lipoyl-binding protein [Polyangia bacterium]
MSSTGEVPAIDGRRPTAAGTPAIAPADTAAPAASNKKKRSIGLVVVLVLAGLGAAYYLHGRSFEDTDDAQIDGNITSLGSRVSGTVTATHVVENQTVAVGDVLVEIDPADLAVAVVQAKAAVAQAQAQL